MPKKKLFKSKSNFSIRRLHQSGNFGNIYERDYTTIVNSLDNPGGQIPILNSPSFKLTVGNSYNKRKKYFYGNWNNNPNTLETTWTLDNTPNKKNTSSGLKIKAVSKRLNDFACYGSSSELIRVSLTNIVLNYPAEIYVTDKLLSETSIFDPINNSGSVSINSEMYGCINNAIIDNPMFIDLIQSSIPENSTVNSLRYMCNSVDDYEVITSNGTKSNIVSWDVLNSDDTGCLKNGDLMATVNLTTESGDTISIKCFYVNEEITYLTDSENIGVRIRPKEKIINDFFNGLNDFESILLNRKTNFTSTFETYYEDDENGWQMYEKKYTWPVTNGDWNIAINGMAYSTFIDGLSELSETYDELFTNSIQRDMTHESVSNMDITSGIVFDGDEYVNNSSKLNKVLNVIGRQFDEIKRSIDNIKTSNNITYSEENNTPDYFLSDNLNLSGWEVKSLMDNVDSTIQTQSLYSGMNMGFNTNDVNNEFMRRLKLNSKYILSKKGTKQCIEDLMAIFGYHSTDWIRRYYGKLENSPYLRKSYILTETTYVANGYSSNKTPEDVLNNVKRINQLKDSYNIENINSEDGFIDPFQGLPVAEISTNIPNDSNDDNTIPLNEIPNERVDDVKYIKDDANYYEWISYKELSKAPSDFNNKVNVSGTTIPNDKVSGTAKYIMMHLYCYQWTGIYKKLDSKPTDANNVSNFIEINTEEQLNTKVSGKDYVKFNNKYYSWDDESNDGNGCYVEVNGTPSDLQVQNVKLYNSIPKVQDNDYKYILVNGKYYQWDGKYSLLDEIPEDIPDNDITYGNELPKEKNKKFFMLNTYLTWVGAYKIYERKVLVPWFDKNLDYDGGLYYQMNGAWGRNDGKTDSVDIIEDSVYGYSISKIHYCSTINELYELPYRTIDVNGIYYIGNDDIYLKVKDIEKYNKSDGWEVPTDDEIIQSLRIIDNNKGNNPHTGNYDNGYSYAEMYGQLFKNSTFNNVKNEEIGDNSLYGFNIARYGESTKCKYFGSNNSIEESIKPLRYNGNIVPNNFFGGESYEESASFSIINSKEFHITFDDSHRDFIENDVIPYVSQIIPSTTIFSYSFEHITGDENAFIARTGNVVCDGGSCPIFGVK